MQNENGSPKKSLLSAQVDLSKFDSSYFRAATEEEKKQQDVMSESTTFFKDGIRRLKKNPLAMGSLVVLILILLIIIIAPHIVPYSYDQIITVNGVRDKSAKNLGMMEYSPRELQYKNYSRISLVQTVCAVITLSVLFTEQESALQ